jgi:hypothetical protein
MIVNINTYVWTRMFDIYSMCFYSAKKHIFFFLLSYPPFLNRQGESQQNWF